MSTKKTLYVDVDEEITGIIDKVRSADESILALVLPKRATVLQSIVNMKLLKRSADQGEKRIVLITSESNLMPLAGAAGIHVAPNLQTRPYMPAEPGAISTDAPVADLSEEQTPIDPETPIGNLAPVKDSPTDPIEIDNRPKEAIAPIESSKKAAKPAKDKSKKVPNFKRFRVALFVGAAAFIALIIFGIWAFAIAPKATVTLRTETSETPVQAQFSADTDADQINTENSVVPATQKEIKKTETEKVAASGEKDNGTKASGSVTLRNCTDNKVTVPAGTGVSNGSQTFITQNSIQLGEGEFSSPGSGSQCRTKGDHIGSVGVVAQENGDQYNLSPRSYTVNGFGGVVAQGDQMNGGSSKVVKVVTAADVEAAKKKISDKQNSVVTDLKGQLQDSGFIGLVDTFNVGTPNYVANPAVGAEASEVSVSGEVTYTMLGLKESDLKKIIEAQSNDSVDSSKQTILNYGFDEASYEVGAKKGSTTAITVKTTLVAGPEIQQDDLKKELAGKKANEVQSLLKSRPGITDVDAKFSPFWVSKVPGKASKIDIKIEQANGKPVKP